MEQARRSEHPVWPKARPSSFTRSAKRAQLIRPEAADPDRKTSDTADRLPPAKARRVGPKKKIPLRNPEIPPLRDSEIRRLSRAVAAEKHPMISGPQPISGFRSAI
uniref:Uncharacterized protein n=1 Tax=Rhizobium laguerreae TaxID=1076926 RepID=A0A6N9ZFZ9_9HYPH|nr:hypothetical protein [Rhizobium laguerreae]